MMVSKWILLAQCSTCQVFRGKHHTLRHHTQGEPQGTTLLQVDPRTSLQVDPPPDPGADPLPPKINNMDNVSGAGTGTGTGKWDELLGLDNSPPPPYSSFMPSGHTGDFGPPPNAPPPSLPGDGQPVRREFPPDVSPGATNLKDGDKPKPSPRSKFGEGTNADFNLPDLPTIPDLPSVPGSNTVQNPNETTEDIDFDDLTKRFEELKKKK
nr:IST1 homolog [Penaeus vannamei]